MGKVWEREGDELLFLNLRL